MNDPEKPQSKLSSDLLPVEPSTTPPPAEPPPVMGCVVYLKSTDNGVSGRVVNLPGVTATAANERDLMRAIVKDFKAQVTPIFARGDQPEWVDPLPPREEGERKLFLPVHL
ncbi:hypothetical protein [Roseiconus lacunae]|uniref:hypothetical protein n=1 Tax=Roseiconus lacunae TaxID=2605694 RepID=UPI0011F1C586|nr:hypothetical protein [Roseiconus lacunae]